MRAPALACHKFSPTSSTTVVTNTICVFVGAAILLLKKMSIAHFRLFPFPSIFAIRCIYILSRQYNNTVLTAEKYKNCSKGQTVQA